MSKYLSKIICTFRFSLTRRDNESLCACKALPEGAAVSPCGTPSDKWGN